MQAKQVEELIGADLPDARVQVDSGDGRHFAALIIAPDFVGMSKIQRHQMIYRSLGDLVGGEIHALTIRAYSPDEWDAAQESGRA